jgi:hypothetical protein
MKMKNVITNYNYKNNKLCFFAGLPEIAGNCRNHRKLQESQEIAGIAGIAGN